MLFKGSIDTSVSTLYSNNAYNQKHKVTNTGLKNREREKQFKTGKKKNLVFQSTLI